MRLGLATFLLLAAAAGCTDPTAMRISVGGDLRPGVDMDRLDIDLSRAGAQVWSRRYDVTSDRALPLEHRVEAPSEAESLVDVTVRATLSGREVLEVTHEASFVRGETVTVEICLWQRCVGLDSADGACRTGSCEVSSDGDGDADDDADGPDAVEPDADADAPTLCRDTCAFAGGGTCDDGGEGSTSYLCDYGTDCEDCGPRAPTACVPRCEVRECGATAAAAPARRGARSPRSAPPAGPASSGSSCPQTSPSSWGRPRARWAARRARTSTRSS